MENDKLWRLIRNRATTGRHSSAHSPHREQIISLGRAGCRHHHDGLESMTTFAGIRPIARSIPRIGQDP